MTWDQREVYIASHVFKNLTLKKPRALTKSRLNDGNDNLQSGRTMFLKTPDIGCKTIQYWVYCVLMA